LAIALNELEDEREQFVTIKYIESDGTKKIVKGEVGKNLMEIAHENNVDLEGMKWNSFSDFVWRSFFIEFF
jgi:GTPase Era involved in 16S rRNA processing